MPFTYTFKEIRKENLSKFLDNIFLKLSSFDTNPLLLGQPILVEQRKIIEKAFEGESAIKIDSVDFKPCEHTLNAIIGFSGPVGYVHQLHIKLDKLLDFAGVEQATVYVDLQKFNSGLYVSILPGEVQHLLIAKFHFSAQEELYQILMDVLGVIDNGLQDLNPASSARSVASPAAATVAAQTKASDSSEDDEELRQALTMSAQPIEASAAASAAETALEESGAADLCAPPAHSPVVRLAPRAQTAESSGRISVSQDEENLARRTVDAAFSDSENTLAMLGEIFQGLTKSTTIPETNLKKHFTQMLTGILRDANPGQRVIITSILENAGARSAGQKSGAR